MKVRIRKIRAPEPTHFGPDGGAARWRPMVLELLVEEPKNLEEAATQLREAKGWAYPSAPRGNLMLAPPALQLAPFVDWPTCAKCKAEVQLTKLDDDSLGAGFFMAECHLCGGASDGTTPYAALAAFAKELGPEREDS